MRIKTFLISGAAIVVVVGALTLPALASKGAKAPAKPATAEVTVPDNDNIQQGDQTGIDGPDIGSPSESTGEVTTPDTDSIQQGDQTGPDGSSTSSNSVLVTASHGASAAEQGDQTGPDENGTGQENGESENSAESDGPDGHQDPPGQQVDHQFEGQE